MPTAEDLGFIHYFQPAQKGVASKAHTLLLLHGTGGNETDLVEIGKRIAPSAAIISPRGKSLEEGVTRFFRRLREGVFDVEDLKYRTGELVDFVRGAAIKYGFDPKPVIVGYSNGANIAASLLLLRPETLEGAILFRPMLPFVPAELPKLENKPVFLGSGEMDPIVPRSSVEALERLLREAGAKVTLYWKINGTHFLSSDEIEVAREWFHDQGMVP